MTRAWALGCVNVCVYVCPTIQFPFSSHLHTILILQTLMRPTVDVSATFYGMFYPGHTIIPRTYYVYRSICETVLRILQLYCCDILIMVSVSPCAVRVDVSRAMGNRINTNEWKDAVYCGDNTRKNTAILRETRCTARRAQVRWEGERK